MTTVALAEDHHLVRKLLRSFLETHPGIKIVGEATNGIEAIELVQKKRPDILLLDLALPRIHGLDVVRQVALLSKTKVLVVSMHFTETYVAEALASGASGYVLKTSMPDELIKGIREVAAGRKYFSDELEPILPDLKFSRSTPSYGLDSLTRREKIVLELAAAGHNNTQIARQLSLSPRTIESHRASLMRKLKLRSQTDIVRFAIRRNIISV